MSKYGWRLHSGMKIKDQLNARMRGMPYKYRYM